MYCFGVSNHSPDQTLAFLRAKKFISDDSDVAIVPAGTVLKDNKKPARSIIFILSVQDFYRNMTLLNSKRYDEIQVFVFASPLRIREIENVVALDFEVSPASSGLGFALRKDFDVVAYRAGRKSKLPQVRRKVTEYLTMLTDNVKRGSLLNPLMTFIYTLPSSTHQTPIKEAVAKYLYKGTSYSKLEATLDAIEGVVVSKRIRDRLKEILKSEIGESYREAFKFYREQKEAEKSIQWSSICKKFGTSDYEMKYIKSIVEAAETNKGVRGKTVATASQKQAALTA